MKNLKQRQAHWRSILDRYEASGLNRKEFCNTHQIDLAQFQYYHRKFTDQARGESKLSPGINLAPVILKSPPTPEKIHLKLPNGIECYLPYDIKDTSLLKLIQGLRLC